VVSLKRSHVYFSIVYATHHVAVFVLTVQRIPESNAL